MPLQRLEHYLVLSDDIHGTRDFYRDVLGMADGFRPELDFPAGHDDKRSLDRLIEMGFRTPLETSARVRRWLSGEHRSLRSEAGRAQLRDLLPVLLEHFGRTEHPDAALVPFDDFLANLTNAIAKQEGAVASLKVVNRQPDFIEALVDVDADVQRLHRRSPQ